MRGNKKLKTIIPTFTWTSGSWNWAIWRWVKQTRVQVRIHSCISVSVWFTKTRFYNYIFLIWRQEKTRVSRLTSGKHCSSKFRPITKWSSRSKVQLISWCAGSFQMIYFLTKEISCLFFLQLKGLKKLGTTDENLLG